jgi:hypothetical protein
MLSTGIIAANITSSAVFDGCVYIYIHYTVNLLAALCSLRKVIQIRTSSREKACPLDDMNSTMTHVWSLR